MSAQHRRAGHAPSRLSDIRGCPIVVQVHRCGGESLPDASLWLRVLSCPTCNLKKYLEKPVLRPGFSGEGLARAWVWGPRRACRRVEATRAEPLPDACERPLAQVLEGSSDHARGHHGVGREAEGDEGEERGEGEAPRYFRRVSRAFFFGGQAREARVSAGGCRGVVPNG